MDHQDTAASGPQPQTGGAVGRISGRQRLTDALLRALGRYVFSIFFREIKVVGAEIFPRSGPVLAVANHFNSIADGALVTTYLPRIPRMLTASIIWDFRVIVPLLEAASVIPVYRKAETGDSAERNRDSFAAVYDLFQSGGVLGVFPEGVSHNEPGVKPLKSGAARIVLEAEKTRGPLGIQIVPVGLFFEAKSKFRSRLLICIGEPVDYADLVDAYRAGDARVRGRAVRRLSDRIHAALLGVTPSFDNWEDARLLGRAADMWAQPEMELPAKVPLVESFTRRRNFLAGYTWMQAHHPGLIAEFRSAMRHYDRMLRETGLRDEEVAATYPPGPTRRRALRNGLAMILLFPFAMIGTAFGYVPYKLTEQLGRGIDPDKRASWRIFGSVIVFPVCWAVQAGLAGLAWGRWLDKPGGGWVALGAFAAPMLFGRHALDFHDLFHRAWHRARAWRLLRRQPRLARTIRAERREVLGKLEPLVNLYDTAQSD